MKKVISISLAGALVISTIWWLNRGGDDRTALITVGIDGPIPDSMVFDPSEMNAADLYLEETPDTRMTFRRMYYELKPEVSTSLFLEAMADGVQFFITTQPSTLAVESRHLFTNGSALLINTSSTSPLLSGQDDYILRIIPDARSEQAVMARLLNGLSARRVLILQDESNPRYTDPAYAFFTNALAALGDHEITHRKLRVDGFEPEAYRALFEEPFDALYILAGDFLVAIGSIAQFFHYHHAEAPILLTPWARSPMILETMGDALERIVLPGHHPSRSENPAIGDYLTRFRQRFDYEPHSMALFVRQAMELLESAFAAGFKTPVAVKDYLLSKPLHTTSLGPVAFDAHGDIEGTLYIVHDLSGDLR